MNGILVGEHAFRATETRSTTASAQPVVGKGKRGPIARLGGCPARSRFGVDVAPRRPLRSSAATRELDRCSNAGARARGQRPRAQLVTLVGVPGIGKSRLVFELFERDRSEDRSSSLASRSFASYGEGVTFWALGGDGQGQAGILDSDTPTRAEEKLPTRSRRLSASVTRGSSGTSARSSVWREAEVGNRRRRLAAWRRFLEGSPSSGRSCSYSRISIGPTTRCSTSSTSSSTGRAASRCSYWAPRARS